ncbi:MAG: hypothetical protein ACLQKA_02210 [Bryobacteraceae bacterium]
MDPWEPEALSRELRDPLFLLERLAGGVNPIQGTRDTTRSRWSCNSDAIRSKGKEYLLFVETKRVDGIGSIPRFGVKYGNNMEIWRGPDKNPKNGQLRLFYEIGGRAFTHLWARIPAPLHGPPQCTNNVAFASEFTSSTLNPVQ